MNDERRVSAEAIVDLLRRAAPTKSLKLDELVRQLDPAIELDCANERILFKASRNPNVITIGVKCTCRLQAHAYVSAIIAIASSLPPEAAERKRFYRIADSLLNWAVSRDLQQWLVPIEGSAIPLDKIIKGSEQDLPEGLLLQLDVEQRRFGEGLFRLASVFILLHELGHMALGHAGCKGVESIEQEKDADRFAASWLLDDLSTRSPRRVNCLLGIATALLWPTIFNVYLGPNDGITHPNAYDRLFQVLDQHVDGEIEEEVNLVWDFVEKMLYIHMEHAACSYDPERLQGHPREGASYLIDLLSRTR
jgi:hypothetical protein